MSVLRTLKMCEQYVSFSFVGIISTTHTYIAPVALRLCEYGNRIFQGITSPAGACSAACASTPLLLTVGIQIHSKYPPPQGVDSSRSDPQKYKMALLPMCRKAASDRFPLSVRNAHSTRTEPETTYEGREDIPESANRVISKSGGSIPGISPAAPSLYPGLGSIGGHPGLKAEWG